MKQTTMIVDVTAADIGKGRRKSPISCPIANALRRSGYRCLVYGNSIFIGRSEYTHSTNSAVFLYRFDQGKKVYPQRFRIKRV